MPDNTKLSSKDWVREVSREITSWMKEKNLNIKDRVFLYRIAKAVFPQLDVDQSIKDMINSTVLKGKNSDFYAVLYALGIKSANPKLIPSRKDITRPNYEERRSWTESAWRNFLNKEGYFIHWMNTALSPKEWQSLQGWNQEQWDKAAKWNSTEWENFRKATTPTRTIQPKSNEVRTLSINNFGASKVEDEPKKETLLITVPSNKGKKPMRESNQITTPQETNFVTRTILDKVLEEFANNFRKEISIMVDQKIEEALKTASISSEKPEEKQQETPKDTEISISFDLERYRALLTEVRIQTLALINSGNHGLITALKTFMGTEVGDTAVLLERLVMNPNMLTFSNTHFSVDESEDEIFNEDEQEEEGLVGDD